MRASVGDGRIIPPRRRNQNSGLIVHKASGDMAHLPPQAPDCLGKRLVMYRSVKSKPRSRQPHKPPSGPGKGKFKMAPEPPELDDATQLSAEDPASPADSLHQFPTDLRSPLPADPDNLLDKFRSIVRDEITTASRKLSSDLVRGLKEIGHSTNQPELCMDLATTVLEGHEEVDKMAAELDKISWRTQRIGHAGTAYAFAVSQRLLLTYRAQPLLSSKNWLPRSQWRGSSSTVFTGPWHLNPQMPSEGCYH